MEDNTLATQYAQTGDLMDLCNDEMWLRESAQIEDEVGPQLEVGLVMKEYSCAINNLTIEQSQQMQQQMRVQSILFTGLRQWMGAWDLGASFEGTYAIARRLIRNHLATPTPLQQEFIEELLAEDAQAGYLTQQQVVAILSEVFTQEDWQAMAKAASQSISLQVLRAGQAQIETAVT
jgi:hypothetical protein